jgi:DNA-binding LacI/PurR family transcriptional regulator
MAAWSPYNLTTFRQDAERITREVIAILDQRRVDPDQPPIVSSFPVDLVVRGTVRRPK